jgi:FeS assembly SUF system regulator
MLRISKITDHGTRILTYMAQQIGVVFAAPQLAEVLDLGVPTVRKILKALTRAGLLQAFRGVAGGYLLVRQATSIRIIDIIDALEDQPFGLTECTLDHKQCSQEKSCSTRASWQKINRVIRHALENISLADMMDAAPHRLSGKAQLLLSRPSISRHSSRATSLRK